MFGHAFALGFDAYRLVPLLENQPRPLTGPVSGMTGILSTDAQGRIHRELVWAEIRGGMARPAPLADEVADNLAAAEAAADGG